MRLILKILNIFFVILGVVFFCLLVAAYYLYTADPFGIKPFLFPEQDSEIVEEEMSSIELASSTDKHPVLTESQEKTLEAVGVDPAKLPTEMTPELRACFEDKLGIDRVNEIAAGGVPTITDALKTRDCL